MVKILSWLKAFLDKIKGFAIPIVIILVLFVFFSSKLKQFWTYLKGLFNAVGSDISDSEIASLSIRLQDLIHGYTSASERAKMVDLLSPLSNPNWHALQNDFGVKWYDTIFGNFGIPYLSSSMTLVEILALELDDEDKQRLRNNNPNIIIA